MLLVSTSALVELHLSSSTRHAVIAIVTLSSRSLRMLPLSVCTIGALVVTTAVIPTLVLPLPLKTMHATELMVVELLGLVIDKILLWVRSQVITPR